MEPTSYRHIWSHENFVAFALSLAAFTVPFLFQHPQIIVGVTVNLLLVIAAHRLPWNKAMPVILLPSIGVLASGIVFGPLSPYVVPMIPAIWAGNAVLYTL
jgi:uncharacterized membrane protein